VKKLTYLESLRGLAALAVVFNHLAIAFYPALFFGPSAPSHTGRALEAAISGTPLNLLYNGAFSVSIFFVLSGFVLSYGFFRDRSATVALLPLAVPLSRGVPRHVPGDHAGHHGRIVRHVHFHR